jgi:hypothetical protein
VARDQRPRRVSLFQDVLLDNPSERERWFQFKQARLRERILGWLASKGVELLAS